jgi:hypothetical protein
VDSVTAAHIAPCRLNKSPYRHLFGQSSGGRGHLMTSKNGLPMMDVYETMLDSGASVNVPHTSAPDPDHLDAWQVMVLDDKIRNQTDDSDDDYQRTHLPLPGSELHGRRLKFNKGFRPSKTYLFFAYCMKMARRERYAENSVVFVSFLFLVFLAFPFFPFPGETKT